MKVTVLLIVSALMALVSCKQPENEQASAAPLVEDLQQKEQPEQGLRHVVLFKFKDSSSQADIDQVVEAFRKLPNEIEGILDFEWGTDVSPEGLSDGFTHVFFVTFKDEQSRDVYLPHPAHKAFGGIVGPHLDKVLVVDYLPQQ